MQTQQKALAGAIQRWRRPDRFTVAVIATIVGLVVAIVLVILRGNQITVPPRIAYLGPLGSAVQNLYMVDPVHPGSARQLTSSAQGVVSFDMLPDGSGLIYAETQPDGTVSLYRFDLATDDARMVYACKDALCENPAVRPDGGAVAFDKIDLNTGTALPPSVARVWILDLATGSAAPLFSDNQKLGHQAVWSPDGTRIAVFDTSLRGIVVHNFTTQKDMMIPEDWANVSQFSPDGRWLYTFKGIFWKGRRYVNHLALIDVSGDSPMEHNLVGDDDGTDDVDAVWQADSKGLIVALKPADAKDADSPDLYTVDAQTGTAKPLLASPNYSKGDLSINRAGDDILFQQFTAGSNTGLWSYNLTTKALTQVASNPSIARWIP